MADPGGLSGQLKRGISDSTASIHQAASGHVESYHQKQSNRPLSTDDPPTTTEAFLKILTAVEHISSRMNQHSDDPSSEQGVKSEGQFVASSSDIMKESIATQEDDQFPDVQRLPMSDWNPPAFLTKRPHGERQSIITAFYTEVPTIATAEELVSDADFIAAYSKDKWSSAPQRILIRSKEVMDELRGITNIPDTQKTGVLAMVPPFKYLIHYRTAIKSKLDELKEAASDCNRASSVAEDDVVNEGRRIHRLQCIHDFIQTDLAIYLGFEIRVQNGTIEEILFEEAYHLFRPGALIFGAGTGDNQIYQVASVTGGRVLLSSHCEGDGKRPQTHKQRPRAGTWMDIQVSALLMAWDGENIGPRDFYFVIPHFTGTRLVTDLGAFPVQFHKDGCALLKHFCARGLKYIQCSGHKRYTGTPVSPHVSLLGFNQKPPEAAGTSRGGDNSAGDEEGRSSLLDMTRADVYIDLKSFFTSSFSTEALLSHIHIPLGEPAEAIDTLTDGRSWNCSDHDIDNLVSARFLRQNRHLTKFGKPKDDLTDGGRLQLLPGQVPAFVFSTRKWEWLDIDKIEDIDKSEESRNSGWRELVIPHKFSELLLSLVSNHVSDVRVRQWEALARHDSTDHIDLVRGKGRGLIVLLHGPPGSGKTSTAETIAAYTGRPLYAITCGDIGTSPKELERNLMQHTRLAQKWGCVLLLDEADVFLGSRTYDNMHRNAVVSVFLRQLDYYSGILFLTTNIVGVIDEAFKSRIHVALEYPAIDEESTLEIWSRMLQRIKRNNEKAEMKIRFDETALLKFAKRHYRDHRPTGTTWNGRQIRNAFQTAIGIGQYKRLEKIDQAEAQGKLPEKSSQHIRLTVASFETVAETTSDFERYIRSTRGDDRERAATHEYRRDEQSSEPPPRKAYRNPVSMYHTDQPTGVSRTNRSRLYAEASTSSGPRRTSKGKEVRGKASRVARSASASDSDEHTSRDTAKHHSSDVGSDEDIIEHLEDEDEDEAEAEEE